MFVHVQYTIYFLSGSTHPLLKEITQEVPLVRRRDTPPLPHLNGDHDHVTSTEQGMIEFLFDIFIYTCTYIMIILSVRNKSHQQGKDLEVVVNMDVIALNLLITGNRRHPKFNMNCNYNYC